METTENQTESEQVPDWILAKKGIQMLLNNNGKEAQNLFLHYPNSLIMFAGYSFTVFMDALMTFEEDKINLATTVLKEVEQKCTSADNTGGWLKSMKNKAFSNQNSLSTIEIKNSLADQIETQIILADSYMCLAILTFLQQDLGSYFKGGWVLRKSWKIYQSVYEQVSRLFKEIVGEAQFPNDYSNPIVADSPDNRNETITVATNNLEKMPTGNGYTKISQIPSSHSVNNILHTTHSPTNNRNYLLLKKSLSVNTALSKHNNNYRQNNWGVKLNFISFSYLTSTFNLFSSSSSSSSQQQQQQQQNRFLRKDEMNEETIKRLMGAVSFGYGLFQLGISLLPPSLLKLTNFLGFGGNRLNGITCLMYAREGVDMRAPLATLSLLWYHTIVRPFYVLDGNNIQAGVDSAAQLLCESDEEFDNSALFLFFKGRVSRLNSNIPQALKSYQLSVNNATQREIKILSQHEVGWCYLIQLDYKAAANTFNYLKSWSRWSRGFYSYLNGITTGSCNIPMKGIKDELTNTLKGNQLDEFLQRRSKFWDYTDNIQGTFWRLLVYEMLYLWNALPSCSIEDVNKIVQDCLLVDQNNDVIEPMLGLSKLILGCCYCIQKNYTVGINVFEQCLALRKNLSGNVADAHVSAFAQYELGSLLIREEERKQEGKLLLQQINQYKDYDFEQRLNVRVHSILKHL